MVTEIPNGGLGLYGIHYYYRFINPITNKQNRISTGHTDYKKAGQYILTTEFRNKILKKLNLDYGQKVWGSTPSNGENTLIIDNTDKTYFLKDLIPLLNQYAKSHFKKGETKTCDNIYKKFIEIVGDKPLNEYTNKDIEKYKSYMTSHHGNASFNLMFRILRANFYRAIQWELMTIKNPCVGTKQIKLIKRKHNVFNKQEIDLLLNKCPKEWLKDVLIFAINTGMRREELINLRWRNILLDKNTIWVSNYKNFTTKNSEDRLIPILPMLKQHILLMQSRLEKVNSEDFLFKGDRLYTNLTGGFVSHEFKELVRDCKLPEEFHFHSLRHTFASTYYKATKDIYAVQKILGHADIKTTMIYTHLDIDEIQEQSQNLNLY